MQLHPEEGLRSGPQERVSKPRLEGRPTTAPGLLRRHLPASLDQAEDFAGGFGDVGAGAVNGGDALGLEEIVVLLRDDAAADHQDIVGALVAKGFDQLGHEGLVAGGLAADADDMDIVLDRLARRFLRRGEKRADIDVEADICEGGCDDPGAAVMAVLAQLGDQQARPAAFVVGEGGDFLADPVEIPVVLIGRAVDAADRLGVGAVAAPGLLHGVGDFADRGAGARGGDAGFEQVAVCRSRRLS